MDFNCADVVSFHKPKDVAFKNNSDYFDWKL